VARTLEPVFSEKCGRRSCREWCCTVWHSVAGSLARCVRYMLHWRRLWIAPARADELGERCLSPVNPWTPCRPWPITLIMLMSALSYRAA
jgi:hypothetical protein